MSDFLDTISVLILVSSFVLMANKRTKSYIKTFRFQSALIAAAAGVLGVRGAVEEGSFDVLIVCAIIVILKVIFIPNYLKKTHSNVEYTVEKDFILNIPVLVIVCCALVIFTYFSISSIDGLSRGNMNVQLVSAISVILIGLFFMISRKKAIGQIIGFLVIENGLFISAMFATEGMPFIVDIGIFIDLLTAVMVMGIMVFRINDKFETINVHKLKNLRG